MKTVDISYMHLGLATLLVLAAGLLSALLRLGLLRSLLWGTVRTFAQLILTGYVLTYIFKHDHPLVLVLVLCLMTLLAARASVQRLKEVPERPYGLAALALGGSMFLVALFVCRVVIAGTPWYAARIVLPISGMLLGNSLNGVSLALDRLYSEARAHAREIELRLALGFTPWEAIRPHVRAALRAGMTPTINALMVVGVVSLPGMMTGQILAGAEPLTAVRYQIVVMLMIAASVTIGCLTFVGLSYRRCFTADAALRAELRS